MLLQQLLAFSASSVLVQMQTGLKRRCLRSHSTRPLGLNFRQSNGSRCSFAQTLHSTSCMAFAQAPAHTPPSLCRNKALSLRCTSSVDPLFFFALSLRSLASTLAHFLRCSSCIDPDLWRRQAVRGVDFDSSSTRPGQLLPKKGVSLLFRCLPNF